MGDRERDDGPPKRDDFKVFVGGLSWQMKEGDLKEGKSAQPWRLATRAVCHAHAWHGFYGCRPLTALVHPAHLSCLVPSLAPAAFAKYDPVDATIILDRHTNRPRGFGFVWFKDKLGMEDAIRDMHEKELEGRKISVVNAVPMDQTKPGTPAHVLGGGGSGGGGGRGGDYGRGGYPPRGGDPYRDYGRGYDRGYERGGYGGYERPAYGAYDRAAYDRGYDSRGYAAGYADPRGYAAGYA